MEQKYNSRIKKLDTTLTRPVCMSQEYLEHEKWFEDNRRERRTLFACMLILVIVFLAIIGFWGYLSIVFRTMIPLLGLTINVMIGLWIRNFWFRYDLANKKMEKSQKLKQLQLCIDTGGEIGVSAMARMNRYFMELEI